ncbi:MAG TPA: Hpt domain-containing protein, partial [Pyrinomonadaceae bacterium]
MDQLLLREFLAEAEDLIEALAGDLQSLRAHRAGGRTRRGLLDRIFRHAHTLKGSSASVELEETARLAHEFESLLAAARLGRVRLGDAVLDAFDDAASCMAQTLDSAARGEPPPNISAVIERLRLLAAGGESRAVTDS